MNMKMQRKNSQYHWSWQSLCGIPALAFYHYCTGLSRHTIWYRYVYN